MGRGRVVPLPQAKRTSFSAIDAIPLVLLIGFFAPIYLASAYTVPFQVNTDEVTIMLFMDRLSTDTVDPLGLSDYFGFPALPFFLFGRLAKMLGGVTLAHVRMIHALSGLAIIACSYVFLRQLLPRAAALAAAALVGGNHALIAISRMAMRDNGGLLVEVVALALLFAGLKRQSPFLLFVGGAVSGLSFYMYYPARATLIIWIVFLATLAGTLRNQFSLKKILGMVFISIIGAAAVGGPIMLASAKNPQMMLQYARQQFLVLPEGRALQQQWLSSATEGEAILQNIKNGLSLFTNKLHDYGYIYPNYGHGFFDPVSGILVWLGLGVIVLKVSSSRTRTAQDIFALTGLLFLWFVFSFLTTKTPNYTRLLILLPFAAYVAVRAIGIIAERISLVLPERMREKRGRFISSAFMAVATCTIVVWNVAIFWDFAQKGFIEGDDVGGTGRYVEARAHNEQYAFYLAASKHYPYYSWGEPWQWDAWMGFFAGPSQKTTVTPPEEIFSRPLDPPYTIFMSKAVFGNFADIITHAHPQGKLHHILPDGDLLALEVK